MSTTPESSDERGARLVDDEIVARLSKAHRAEAELMRLSHSLRHPSTKDAADRAAEWAERSAPADPPRDLDGQLSGLRQGRVPVRAGLVAQGDQRASPARGTRA